jgi:DNA mismatch endonuclease (patch repair protein)
MAGIRAANTKPELIIRRGLHARGFRFRLRSRRLPGKPDLVLPRYRAVIFVHGCFWHCHECEIFKWPKTRQDFWREKIEGNSDRDKRAEADLRAMGWRVLRIWECSLRGPHRLGSQRVIYQSASWLRSNQIEGEISGSER